MIQALPKTKPVTFTEFVEWKPENKRYELQKKGNREQIRNFSSDGIPEYWIIDYLALGGTPYIGDPKQPTISIYNLVNGEYKVKQFRNDEIIISATFPELKLTANQIFNAGM